MEPQPVREEPLGYKEKAGKYRRRQLKSQRTNL